MTLAILFRFGVALWLSFVLMNVTFAAIGTELCWRGAPINWFSRSFNLRVRIAKVQEVSTAYLAFKRSRREFPLLLCVLGFFASGLIIVPLSCIGYFLYQAFSR